MVDLPGLQPARLDVPGLIQLSPEISSLDLGQREVATQLHPSVPGNLTAEERATIGSVVVDDVGLLVQTGVVDEYGTSLAACGEVLGRMEGHAADMSDGAQWSTLVGGHGALRGVLDDEQVVSLGDVRDGVHVAAHGGIVYGDDDARAVRDGALDEIVVEVHGVFVDVDEDDMCAAQEEGVDS